MKKLVLSLFVFAAALALSFTVNLAQENSSEKDLAASNVEALAAPAETWCLYSGTVDCPRMDIKVYYVIE